MIILDTDHISLPQRPESQEGARLQQHLTASPDREIGTTVITIEVQMRGWLQVIARYRDVQQQIAYYNKLIEFVRFFAQWEIVPLDDAAVRRFRHLQEARVRIATTDLKIAAIALASGATLLSRNSRDFGRVPGLRVEDWTV
jgi:tRNA(fMet)-specific endonuclease VapC